MNDSTSASVSPPAQSLDSRAHTLSGPRTRLQQFAIDLQTALENFIARVSQLPDTPVYASERFAWTQILERSEEHTSELQSLMRISYAVFCLKKKKKINTKH